MGSLPNFCSQPLCCCRRRSWPLSPLSPPPAALTQLSIGRTPPQLPQPPPLPHAGSTPFPQALAKTKNQEQETRDREATTHRYAWMKRSGLKDCSTLLLVSNHTSLLRAGSISPKKPQDLQWHLRAHRLRKGRGRGRGQFGEEGVGKGGRQAALEDQAQASRRERANEYPRKKAGVWSACSLQPLAPIHASVAARHHALPSCPPSCPPAPGCLGMTRA